MSTKNKPYVICHMMSTLDGRITSGTTQDILSDYFDLYTKIEDELSGQAWLCGRVTMKAFATEASSSLAEFSGQIDTPDYLTNSKDNGFFIGIDTKGTLRWDKNTVKLSNVAHEIPLVIVVVEETPVHYSSYLRSKGISYLCAGKESINFGILMEKIKTKLGVHTLLLEGGGNTNGSVLSEDLIDEISLMIVPIILNRTGVPGVFDRQTHEIDVKKFSLFAVTQIEKDCVWLRYKKVE